MSVGIHRQRDNPQRRQATRARVRRGSTPARGRGHSHTRSTGRGGGAAWLLPAQAGFRSIAERTRPASKQHNALSAPTAINGFPAAS